MFEHPKVLVIMKNKNYYLPIYVLDSVLGIVESVTGSRDRAQPISKEQLDLICQRASAAGVRVKVIQTQEEVAKLAVLGECELTPFQWAILDNRTSSH